MYSLANTESINAPSHQANCMMPNASCLESGVRSYPFDIAF